MANVFINFLNRKANGGAALKIGGGFNLYGSEGPQIALADSSCGCIPVVENVRVSAVQKDLLPVVNESPEKCCDADID